MGFFTGFKRGFFGGLLVAVLLTVGLLGMPIKKAFAEHDNYRPGDAFFTVSTSISSGATLFTPSSGKKFKIKYLRFRSDTAGVVAFKEAGSTTVFNFYCAANTDYTFDERFFGEGFQATTADDTFTATLSSAVLTISGRVAGPNEPGT